MKLKNDRKAFLAFLGAITAWTLLTYEYWKLPSLIKHNYVHQRMELTISQFLSGKTPTVRIIVGCITLVLTLGAILLGLWLDGVFGIRPVLTIGFTLLSLPITLYSIFAIVRWTTGRMLNTEQDKAVPEEE